MSTLAKFLTMEVQKVDTFLTIVMAGVIGVVVGAIAAFYLGEVREKQKQISARQREEQRKLEEWRREEQRRLEEMKEREQQREEERKQRLIDRRAEALDDIRIQALSFANAFRTWTDRAANLKVPPKDEVEQAMGFSRELADLIQQADEVSTRLACLRGHYNAHSPILEEKSRKIIESFEKQGIERHSFLSNQLKATAASLQPFLVLLRPDQVVDVMNPTSHSDAISWLAGPGLGTFVSPQRYSRVKGPWNAIANKEAVPEEHRQGVLQAADVAKGWDIHVHLRALDAEVGRIEGIRS
jgi:uncharacterized membrane-anchored protein YhcB (DUF1043 family)